MRTATLLRRSLTYYWRTNLAVILGVATATAVLTGALLVGDSVRASLRDIFLQRIGHTDQVLSSQQFFREKLSDDLQSQAEFSSLQAACPLIALQGLVTHQSSGRRAAHVQVYGVDDRFWRFHGQPVPSVASEGREAAVSTSLAEELAITPGDSILVRIEKPSAIPSESLHGRKEDLGRTIRFTAHTILPPAALGDFSLRPQQGVLRTVFVPLARLQRELALENKVNTILIAGPTSQEMDAGRKAEPSAGEPQQQALSLSLQKSFALEDLGIKLRVLPEQRCLSVESDSLLLSDALLETVLQSASQSKMRSESILTYLANSIRVGSREIPYSLVTAVDRETFAALGRSARKQPGTATLPTSGAAPLLLNEWAARDLGATEGDTVVLEYYLWEETGELVTRQAPFVLSAVVPLERRALDRNYAPEYPGITESASLRNWDPPFPMNLGKIRPADDRYWHQYRTTPKAFISLEKGQTLWGSRYGKVSSVRLFPAAAESLATARQTYQDNLRASLDPTRLGLSVFAARAQGVAASQGATDFGEYFLYFSFFLVMSALLLCALFFRLGIEQRLREIGTVRALGFPATKIRNLFLGEGAVLSTVGCVLGLAGACGYGALMMLGLRTWWVGAVGTEQLHLHVTALTLGLGGAGGILAAVISIAFALRSVALRSPRGLLAGTPVDSRHGDSTTTVASAGWIGFAILGLLLLISGALGWVSQLSGFFGAGICFLIASLVGLSVWFRRRPGHPLSGNGWLATVRLGNRNARYRPGRSVLCITLIASATFIVVAVEAFRREDGSALTDKKSGSGGFALLAESILPLVHNPDTAQGREALNLPPQADSTMGSATLWRFRVRDGDDASCLNLYQPGEPRLLAPTPEFIRAGRFRFANSLATTQQEKENPWLLLERDSGKDVIPVIADANSLTYVLHRKLGEEWVLRPGTASPIRLQVVGALEDSLFQGEVLLAEKHFVRLFPEQSGYRFFLIDAPRDRMDTVSTILEQRLTDFGFDVMPVSERLAAFHRVENTYLSTFQALGGLGLLLGTLGLATVLLRNVLERRRELALQQAVGYNGGQLAVMIVAENALLLVAGLTIGTMCAALAIAPAFLARGGSLPLASMVTVVSSVLIAGLTASVAATAVALRSPLLGALRSE